MAKKRNPTCSCCSADLEETTTVFTLVKATAAYVVKDVPALVCPQCGHTTFTEDVAKKLERYVSGRVIPRRPALTAWLYSYEDAPIELPKIETPTATFSSVLVRAET